MWKGKCFKKDFVIDLRFKTKETFSRKLHQIAFKQAGETHRCFLAKNSHSHLVLIWSL